MASDTQKWAEERLEHWQKRLRVADWRISLTLHDDKYIPPEIADGADDSRATIIWDGQHGHAEMLIATQWPKRLRERAIVHELLHLALRPLCELYDQAEIELTMSLRHRLRDLHEKALELAINKLAEALVR